MTRYDIIKGVEIPKSRCGICERDMPYVFRRRLCTQYADEDSNYMTSCEECFIEHDGHYKERWQEYYAGLF